MADATKLPRVYTLRHEKLGIRSWMSCCRAAFFNDAFWKGLSVLTAIAERKFKRFKMVVPGRQHYAK